MEVNGEEYNFDELIINSTASATPSLSSTARIHRVPHKIKEIHDYEKYYTPKFVSIGPYHFGNPKFDLVQNLKVIFTMKLVADDKETLGKLIKKLSAPNMVQELRNFYIQGSTDEFSDGCFILYYIRSIYTGETLLELRSHHMVFINEDLLLLENQIPYKVLNVIMNVVIKHNFLKMIEFFIMNDNIFLLHGMQNRKKGIRGGVSVLDINKAKHLLHLMQSFFRYMTRIVKPPEIGNRSKYGRRILHAATEIMDAGIHFKPSEQVSMNQIEFVQDWVWYRAKIKLPPMLVDRSTMTMLLNLIAYEMCSHESQEHSCVTSYICLLNSLIKQSEDVKALRKAGVLVNSLGSDNEVAQMFKEIVTDIVPDDAAYFELDEKIHHHYYRSFRNVNMCLSEFKQEYVYSPWAFLAVVGAVLALFLTAVQTYFTVWSPEGKCDNLCAFLNKNHHL